MLFLLSPAKKLDYDTPAHVATATQPLFVDQAQALIKILKTQSEQDIAKLMSLSEALARLNVERYQQWEPTFTPDTAKQAVLAFNGDVYEGLDAKTLSAQQLDWAQEHVVILSGLYGALRPLDLMRPYRLEMGTRLATPQGKNLYDYWGSRLAEYLNSREQDWVVNLASDEYFKAVDKKVLKPQLAECVFQDYKNGQYKIISFHAKRARGLMVRYAIEHGIDQLDGLKGFDLEGYRYTAEPSASTTLVFRRNLES